LHISIDLLKICSNSLKSAEGEKKMKNRYFLIAMFLLLGILAGCGGGDATTPNLPGPGGPGGGGYNGDQPEPPIPTPWAALYTPSTLHICDMEWELDGDLVVSTREGGILLFTPYGLLKRQYPIPCVYSLTNNDSGRGMSYSDPQTACAANGIDDDVYVSQGHNTTVFDELWYKGDPDPTKDVCDLTITMGWGCPATGTPPVGYAYHPISGRTYMKLNSGGSFVGDSECETDWDEEIGNQVNPGELWNRPVGDVILSYDQKAPFKPDIWYTGPPTEGNDPAGDWVIYQDDCLLRGYIESLGLPGYMRMAETVRIFKMNGTDPPS